MEEGTYGGTASCWSERACCVVDGWMHYLHVAPDDGQTEPAGPAGLVWMKSEIRFRNGFRRWDFNSLDISTFLLLLLLLITSAGQGCAKM